MIARSISIKARESQTYACQCSRNYFFDLFMDDLKDIAKQYEIDLSKVQGHLETFSICLIAIFTTQKELIDLGPKSFLLFSSPGLISAF